MTDNPFFIFDIFSSKIQILDDLTSPPNPTTKPTESGFEPVLPEDNPIKLRETSHPIQQNVPLVEAASLISSSGSPEEVGDVVIGDENPPSLVKGNVTPMRNIY